MLALLQELLLAMRAHDADGCKPVLSLGIEELGGLPNPYPPQMKMNISINRELVNPIQGLIEDTVGYLCNEHMISGELVLTCSNVCGRQGRGIRERPHRWSRAKAFQKEGIVSVQLRSLA